MSDHVRRSAGLAAAGLALALSLAGCDLYDLQAWPEDADGYAVAYVVDGDTIDVTDPGGDTQRVRLLGINTPEVEHGGEVAQCGGEEAAAQLSELLPEGTPVELVADSRADDTDRYDRLLRYVETEDGTDVGGELVAGGYAYPWAPRSEPEPERTADYQTAAAEAQEVGAGSWASCPELDESR
ncbi:thermonuclease family protein (plasmid) [Brachybacterium huguangmaarense]|uniref:Thermonuclease family protein n=1 Tax=Brachybacterium huguangmaarense TaxID=1652028 RepID=A0ABY6G5D8_9MICO|nr:thermonuclease family protein [Brachybacterium huguangmaarense]UYG18315.1 thermonuclease family protein [Brachybacterium huguangmaarense]